MSEEPDMDDAPASAAEPSESEASPEPDAPPKTAENAAASSIDSDEGKAGKEENSLKVVQENLEAIVVAIILALIIRHYAMEAFVIPTGSMAPTLLGEHYVVECQNCHYQWPVNNPNGDGFGATCELCRSEVRSEPPFDPKKVKSSYGLNLRATVAHGGNKILVNKFAYRFGKPQRFDVAVFKYPVDPNRNFIKRLVGLPGERIRIRHGDLFADGKLVRKDDASQRDLWHLIYDQRFPSEESKEEPWRPDSPKRWVIRRRGKGSAEGVDEGLLQDEAFIARPAPRRTEIAFTNEIRDWYGYNPTWRQGSLGTTNDGDFVVTDIRMQLEIIPLAPGGPISLGCLENGLALDVDIPTKPGEKLRLHRAEGTFSKAIEKTVEGVALTPKQRNKVEFQWLDRRARLWVNDELVLSWDDKAPKQKPESSSAHLIAPKEGAIFQGLRMSRDIHYFFFAGGAPANVDWDEKTREIIVPKDSYFALGDNCPNSSDGRRWGYLKSGHLVGRAFIVFWPLPAIRLIR